jgi:hypothetical protein
VNIICQAFRKLMLTNRRFKTGYFADFDIKPEEWVEAKARATGRLENAMAFFAPIFEESG